MVNQPQASLTKRTMPGCNTLVLGLLALLAGSFLDLIGIRLLGSLYVWQPTVSVSKDPVEIASFQDA